MRVLEFGVYEPFGTDEGMWRVAATSREFAQDRVKGSQARHELIAHHTGRDSGTSVTPPASELTRRRRLVNLR